MKSFEKYWADSEHYMDSDADIIEFNEKTNRGSYNAGITEGIQDGRRLERESMRCETCRFFKNWCPLEEHTGTAFINEKQRKGFFCGLHERRKE